MIQIPNSKQDFWKVATFILGGFLILSLAGNVILSLGNLGSKTSGNNLSASAENSLTEPVSAQDIYPLFKCPCCSSSIAECACPMARERRNYVDALVEIGQNQSREEIVLAYVEKYGLNSFMDKEKQAAFREKLEKEAPADRPIISLTPASYDFGDVSQKEGKVYTDFEIRNKGKSDLVIDRLETSCGCTFAAIIYQGKESPYFTMPGHDNPTDWEGVTIPPGGTAQLRVMYDPNVHKDFRGAAIREISVFSNDPIDFEKSVQIELNQVD